MPHTCTAAPSHMPPSTLHPHREASLARAESSLQGDEVQVDSAGQAAHIIGRSVSISAEGIRSVLGEEASSTLTLLLALQYLVPQSHSVMSSLMNGVI